MSKKMIPHIYVGTSGWNYSHWEDIFYPPTYAKSTWLQFYAQNFKTLEVNATFYRLPKPETFENWRWTTPEGFIWAVKANRYITHIKRLQDTGEALEKFFGVASTLKEKSGPVLFQLPPGLTFDEDTLDEFCNNLEKYNHASAFEVRHKSWLSDRVMTKLERHGIAFCISDTAGRYPYEEAITAVSSTSASTDPENSTYRTTRKTNSRRGQKK